MQDAVSASHIDDYYHTDCCQSKYVSHCRLTWRRCHIAELYTEEFRS